MIRMWCRLTAAALTLAVTLGGHALIAFPARQSDPIDYDVRFPEPEHHWLEVTMSVTGLGGAPLRARMSRSSPGRYAVHEFAKNVFAITAVDGRGQTVAVRRSGVDQWVVDRHDGTVRLTYRLFGDTPDGTYLGIDTTHAHMNMPATFMWAEGMDRRPIRITFAPPASSGWTAATQLFPTASPLTFTAPNLQYFMDSPVELAKLVVSTFTAAQSAGPPAVFRVMAHSSASQSDIDALAALVRRVVLEEIGIFGALPRFDSGAYTFIIDAVPWAKDDAMEHRNSTYISLSQAELRSEAGRRLALDAVAHEFFHTWNVERIRPQGLEPFDFTQQNLTCCLWLAEGFTQYYGSLALRRAGLSNAVPYDAAVGVLASSAGRVRSAVEMSEHAPFTDASVSIDATDSSRTFISYYTHGAAIALALDLALRDRSNGRVSLDDFMRRLWTDFGVAPAEPGYVARPYSLRDLRTVLGAVDGDRTWADQFFDRHVEGREAIDYTRLLARAGYVVEPALRRATLGRFPVNPEPGGLRVGHSRFADDPSLVPFGSAGYDAGLDSGDLIVAIDGEPATFDRWNALSSKPVGTAVVVEIMRRDGRRAQARATLAADPTVRIVPIEDRGQALTVEQKAFREGWLGSKQ
jgi:predicted metalloprotease with PDZ domain